VTVRCYVLSPLFCCPSVFTRLCNARFPPFRCRSSVAVSPFCRFKIPLFCKNYVRKFHSVTAVSREKIYIDSGYGNGNGVRKRQRLTGTAKRKRKNGNGMMKTGHKAGLRRRNYFWAPKTRRQQHYCTLETRCRCLQFKHDSPTNRSSCHARLAILRNF